VTWVKWKLISVHFERMLISTEDRCTVCNECSMGMEIFLGRQMELLGDMSQMEACFGLYGDSVNLGARSVHGLRRIYHGHANRFGCT
jgi:hypothetical protein